MISKDHSTFLIGLERSLIEQDRMHGCTRDDIQRENLEYAFRKISPSTHTESAFVVWAGTRCQPVHDIVDEYCRRRLGLAPIMFDHDLLNLRVWCQPDTHRILIFREQLESLVNELTGRSDGQRVTYEIYRHETNGDSISLDKFASLIDADAYKLSHEEIAAFYHNIRDSYATSLPYTWCSTIVERAISATKGKPE
jgi:hypothetical protein